MTKITEVKIKRKDSDEQKRSDEQRQFDLQSAYKLLISAYLRTDLEENNKDLIKKIN